MVRHGEVWQMTTFTKSLAKTYLVHFVSGITHVTFKVGEYKSRKAIRKAQTRYDNEYGAYLSLRIIDKTTLQQVSIHEVV